MQAKANKCSDFLLMGSLTVIFLIVYYSEVPNIDQFKTANSCKMLVCC